DGARRGWHPDEHGHCGGHRSSSHGGCDASRRGSRAARVSRGPDAAPRSCGSVVAYNGHARQMSGHARPTTIARFELHGSPLEAADLLRIGTYQLLAMGSVPAYAAIAQTVELVKRRHGLGASKLANAVLRRIDRERDSLGVT